MAKFYVDYTHEVEIKYRALVEAENEDEAKAKIEDALIVFVNTFLCKE